ncbi:hypothetical protein P7C73_g4414, partial [Tremellales sp. Uapishka_1]
MTSIYDLTTLGRELDLSRRGRIGADTASETVSETDSGSEPETSPTRATDSSSSPDDKPPFPLCLLCLTRPPTALLLPCCHLNLCHLCAPLLIQKAQQCPRAADAGPSDRIPYNVLLARATAKHPQSRRLAGGGYRPPVEGTSGAELRGPEVLKRGTNESGRVNIESAAMEGEARCLVCRSGVGGWLRVYTG